jgi:hypothetical protein
MARTPTRKAQSAHRPTIPRRSWHIHLARLLRPLTETQTTRIATILPREQATQLLRDWTRVSEVAHQHALVQHARAEAATLLSSPAVRKRRDAQLRKAAIAAGAAAMALAEMVDLWSKHVDAPHQAALAAWADPVTLALTKGREHITRQRTAARAWPKALVKRGQPTQPSTYLLETVLSYFRAHDWPCSLKRHTNPDGDVLVRVVCVALRQSEIDPALRRTLAASRLKWVQLEAAAPRLSEANRALHRTEANKRLPPRGRRPAL